MCNVDHNGNNLYTLLCYPFMLMLLHCICGAIYIMNKQLTNFYDLYDNHSMVICMTAHTQRGIKIVVKILKDIAIQNSQKSNTRVSKTGKAVQNKNKNNNNKKNVLYHIAYVQSEKK